MRGNLQTTNEVTSVKWLVANVIWRLTFDRSFFREKHLIHTEIDTPCECSYCCWSCPAHLGFRSSELSAARLQTTSLWQGNWKWKHHLKHRAQVLLGRSQFILTSVSHLSATTLPSNHSLQFIQPHNLGKWNENIFSSLLQVLLLYFLVRSF